MGEDLRATSSEPGRCRERFEMAFDAHYAPVLAYALRRVPTREVADDIAAETFAVAWRKRQLIPEPTLPWLYAVAANVISNQSRSSRRRSRLRGKLAVQPPSFGRDPADAVTERDAMSKAFQRLSEDQRELLRLVCWEGLGPEEAAVALGCTHVALRARLHRARRKLAQHLDAAGHETEMARPPTSQTPLEETK